ncbi:hypothetical protein RRG08_030664 [Elysia crispata]|uniref:Uncharacterized protein n=1 Tax=Elysia crispata TaxID=231223 RepID=A0AAE1CYV1_9GAST|nr:hypothetical protein RRG08_030664 [Elysia crispata]
MRQITRGRPQSHPTLPDACSVLKQTYKFLAKNLLTQQVIAPLPRAKSNNCVWLNLPPSSSNSCQLLLARGGRSTNLARTTKNQLLANSYFLFLKA